MLKLYKVYLNDDPELTLTYFMTMSNLAKLVFVLIVGQDRYAFTGPLVLWLWRACKDYQMDTFTWVLLNKAIKIVPQPIYLYKLIVNFVKLFMNSRISQFFVTVQS